MHCPDLSNSANKLIRVVCTRLIPRTTLVFVLTTIPQDTMVRSRATQRQPPPFVAQYDAQELADLDAEIASARTMMKQQRDATTTITSLSTLLRRRFFLAGNLSNLQEAFALTASLPMPTVDDIGTASIAFHPELKWYEHRWVQWQPWLESQGYKLPARYDPSWTPSWATNPERFAYLGSVDYWGTRVRYKSCSTRPC